MDVSVHVQSISDGKENKSQSEKVFSTAQLPMISPARNPLCDVNNQQTTTPLTSSTSGKKCRTSTPGATKSENINGKLKQTVSVYRDKHLVTTPNTPGTFRQNSHKTPNLQKVVRFDEQLTVIPACNAVSVYTGEHSLHEDDDDQDEQIGKYVDSVLQVTVKEIQAETMISESKVSISVSQMSSPPATLDIRSSSVCKSDSGLNGAVDRQSDTSVSAPSIESKCKQRCEENELSVRENIRSKLPVCSTKISKRLCWSMTVDPNVQTLVLPRLNDLGLETIENGSKLSQNFLKDDDPVPLANVNLIAGFQSSVELEQIVKSYHSVKDVAVSPILKSTTEVKDVAVSPIQKSTTEVKDVAVSPIQKSTTEVKDVAVSPILKSTTEVKDVAVSPIQKSTTEVKDVAVSPIQKSTTEVKDVAVSPILKSTTEVKDVAVSPILKSTTEVKDVAVSPIPKSTTEVKDVAVSPILKSTTEVKDVAVSPIPKSTTEVKDVAVSPMQKSTTEVKDVAVSPIPKSTTEVKDVAVSPILKSTTEVKDVAVSPILKSTTEVKDVALSPILKSTTEVKDVAVSPILKSTTEVKDVAVSPILKSTTEVKDVAVSPILKSTTDVQVSTTAPCCVDSGCMIKPDLRDTSTGTDVVGTRSRETSMTPMKLLSKQGKRVTAAEVRSLHPQVIANQLDTALICNSQMKCEIGRLEEERHKLKGLVKDLKSSSLTRKQKEMEHLHAQCEEDKSRLDKIHLEAVEEFQNTIKKKENRIVELENKVSLLRTNASDLVFKCDMEQQLLDIEKKHAFQVQQLKEEYERSNYRVQFERSQQLVRELQAQLDEYNEILDELEHTEKLQIEYHKSITETHLQLRRVSIQNADMRRNLLADCVSLKKLQAMATDTNVQNTEEHENLVEKCTHLTRVVEISNGNVQQLQTLYSNTALDLQTATAMAYQLNKELAHARKAIQDLVFAKEILINYLDDQQEKEKSLQEENQVLTTTVADLKKDIHVQQILTQEAEMKRLDFEAEMQETISKYEVVITNLQRTLDFREHDNDLLTKDMEMFRTTIQQQCLDIDKHTRERQLFEVKVQDYEESIATVKNMAQFLEDERDLLLMSLSEMERKIQTLSLHQNRQQRALSNSERDCLQLQSAVQSLKGELESTRSHARKMLMDQGREIQNCGQAIENLHLRMTCILRAMKRKVGIEESSDQTRGQEVSTEVKKAPRSLVGAVLAAVNSHTSETAGNQSYTEGNQSYTEGNQSYTEGNQSYTEGSLDLTWSQARPQRSRSAPLTVHCADTDSFNNSQASVATSSSNQSGSSLPHKRLSFSSSPGEASRRRLGYSQSSAFLPVTSQSRRAVNINGESFADSGHASLCESEGLSTSLDQSLSGLQVSSLEDQILTLGEVLGEIVRMANIVEKASQLSIQDLKGEEMVLREQIEQLAGQIERLAAEMILKDEELTTGNQDVTRLQDRLKQMVTTIMDVSDQQSEIKKLKAEIDRLMHQLTRVESEKQVIADQCDRLMERLEARVDGHGLTDTRSLREVVGLKKENHQLKMKLCEESDRYEELARRAARKIKILEDNWKKAEAEVYRFDELVETVRKMLEDNRAVIESNEALARLLQIVNGEEVEGFAGFAGFTSATVNREQPSSNTSLSTPHNWSFFK